MNTGAKGFAIAIGICAAVGGGLWHQKRSDPGAHVKSEQHLDAAFQASPLRERMFAARVSEFKMYCEPSTSKVHATFTILGVKNQTATVMGQTACSTPGLLAMGPVGDAPAHVIRAVKHYAPELFLAELGSLFDQSAFGIGIAHQFDNLVSAELHSKFGSEAFKRGLLRLEFSCDKAGEPMHFQAAYRTSGKWYEKGRVATRCETDKQSFRITLYPARFGSQPDVGATQLRQYNSTKTTVKVASEAYRNFLFATPYATAF